MIFDECVKDQFLNMLVNPGGQLKMMLLNPKKFFLCALLYSFKKELVTGGSEPSATGLGCNLPYLFVTTLGCNPPLPPH